MGYRAQHCASLFWIALLGLNVIGCYSYEPRVACSDPRPFSAEELLAIQSSLKARSLDFTYNLDTYFASTESEYRATQRRMDAMLDASQRQSGYAHVVDTVLKAHLTVLLDGGKAGGGTGSPTSQPTTPQTAPQLASTDAKSAEMAIHNTTDPGGLLKALVEERGRAAVSDSPFDQLDRVSDFYTAMVVKSLRSTVRIPASSPRPANSDETSPAFASLDATYFAADSMSAEAPAPTTSPSTTREPRRRPTGPRIMSLLFQPSVEKGTVENRMVGIRIHISTAILAGGREVKSDSQAFPVSVTRLHPSRMYDVESSGYAESLNQLLSLSGSGSGELNKYAKLSLDAARDATLEAQARQQFLCRLPKVASVTDATNHTFGWNFYPTNLHVTECTGLPYVISWLLGSPQRYRIQAELEPGGRDCMAYLLVGEEVTAIRCQMYFVTANMEAGNEIHYMFLPGGGIGPYRADKAREITVNLKEPLSALVSVAPAYAQRQATTRSLGATRVTPGRVAQTEGLLLQPWDIDVAARIRDTNDAPAAGTPTTKER